MEETTEKQVELDSLILQCREAKLASMAIQVTTVDRAGDQVTYTSGPTTPDRWGVWEDDGNRLCETFLGA